MFGLDAPTHWIILLVVLLALFGYKKLPDMTRSVGRSLRIFKSEMRAMTEDTPVPAATVVPAPVVAAAPAQSASAPTTPGAAA